ncbi:MAG: hypothetical protein PHG00_18065, partial [Methylococcales bacterium]|nr:hypothetical protein [Methylococcales bacterium]
SLWFYNTQPYAGGPFQQTYSIASGDTIVVSGSYLQSSTTPGGANTIVNGGIIEAQGDVAINAGSAGGNASFVFTGPASVQTLSYSGSSMPSGSWVVNKPSGAVVLGSNITFPGALSVNSGILSQGASYNLCINGQLTIGNTGTLVNIGVGGLTLGGSVVNDGGFVINSNGANCGDAQSILIRSTTSGAQRVWSGSGKFMILDADIKDMGGSVSIVAYNSVNSGNNGALWDIQATCAGMEQEDKIYVQEGNSGTTPTGTFSNPYHSIQDAVDHVPADYIVRPYTILLIPKSGNTAYTNGFNASGLNYNFTTDVPEY